MLLRQRVRDVIARVKPTVAGEREVDDARRAATEESKNLLKEIGFDAERATRLRLDYRKRVDELLDTAVARPEEPNYLGLPEGVPKEIHNPWAIYQPPYAGFSWAYIWGRSDEPYIPGFARYLDATSGTVGTFYAQPCQRCR